jgi:transposase InsO family protein
LGLQLRNKTPKRKVKAKLREDRVQATAPNECWSMDFLSDQLFDGRKIRVLAIIDNFTRLSPALDVRHSYKGSDVVDKLERIAADYGRPRRGGEIITKSDRTAPLATKPQWSALLHQGRHACPDAKRAGLSQKGRTKKGAGSTLLRP